RERPRGTRRSQRWRGSSVLHGEAESEAEIATCAEKQWANHGCSKCDVGVYTHTGCATGASRPRQKVANVLRAGEQRRKGDFNRYRSDTDDVQASVADAFLGFQRCLACGAVLVAA